MLSILWVCFGWLLPGAKGGALVCVGLPEEGLLGRYRWLRDLGLLCGPMIIVADMDEPDINGRLFSRGIEICGREALLSRLEQERTYLDGTGNGDPPGRDQRRGISEL